MKNLTRASLLLAVLFFALAGTAHAKELNLDFKLINKTGYTIKEVFIGPSTQEDWGSNILDGQIPDGGSASITFSPKAKATKWDIKVVYDDGETVQWLGYKLDEISKITLFYNLEKRETTAQTE